MKKKNTKNLPTHDCEIIVISDSEDNKPKPKVVKKPNRKRRRTDIPRGKLNTPPNARKIPEKLKKPPIKKEVKSTKRRQTQSSLFLGKKQQTKKPQQPRTSLLQSLLKTPAKSKKKQQNSKPKKPIPKSHKITLFLTNLRKIMISLNNTDLSFLVQQNNITTILTHATPTIPTNTNISPFYQQQLKQNSTLKKPINKEALFVRKITPALNARLGYIAKYSNIRVLSLANIQIKFQVFLSIILNNTRLKAFLVDFMSIRTAQIKKLETAFLDLKDLRVVQFPVLTRPKYIIQIVPVFFQIPIRVLVFPIQSLEVVQNQYCELVMQCEDLQNAQISLNWSESNIQKIAKALERTRITRIEITHYSYTNKKSTYNLWILLNVLTHNIVIESISFHRNQSIYIHNINKLKEFAELEKNKEVEDSDSLEECYMLYIMNQNQSIILYHLLTQCSNLHHIPPVVDKTNSNCFLKTLQKSHLHHIALHTLRLKNLNHQVLFCNLFKYNRELQSFTIINFRQTEPWSKKSLDLLHTALKRNSNLKALTILKTISETPPNPNPTPPNPTNQITSTPQNAEDPSHSLSSLLHILTTFPNHSSLHSLTLHETNTPSLEQLFHSIPSNPSLHCLSLHSPFLNMHEPILTASLLSKSPPLHTLTLLLPNMILDSEPLLSALALKTTNLTLCFLYITNSSHAAFYNALKSNTRIRCLKIRQLWVQNYGMLEYAGEYFGERRPVREVWFGFGAEGRVSGVDAFSGLVWRLARQSALRVLGLPFSWEVIYGMRGMFGLFCDVVSYVS